MQVLDADVVLGTIQPPLEQRLVGLESVSVSHSAGAQPDIVPIEVAARNIDIVAGWTDWADRPPETGQ